MMMVGGDELRAAMSRFPTGVTLLTTRTGDGVSHAMTANSLTSISVEPPLVLVCVGHSRNTYKYILDSGRYGISVLSREHEAAARYYAIDEQDRVGDAPLELTLSASGLPVAGGCVCFLGCEVVASHEHGDHTIFIGRLVETSLSGGEPLVFHDRRYTGLEDGDA